MADKGQIPSGKKKPTPPDLAKEAAEMEFTEHLESAQNIPTPPSVQVNNQENISIEVDMSHFNSEAQVRKTATFSISLNMHNELAEAAAQMHTSRSAVLEMAFNTWWPQAKKILKDKKKK